MPYRDEAWPEGTPCWVDCSVDDPAAARRFYSELFGWEIQDSPPEAGGYLMALKNGRAAAGIGPKMDDAGPMPSAWSTYFAADDVDKTAEKIKSAGGTLLMDPMDVLDVGRMTFALDPAGAAFGLWQPRAHTGAQIFNEHGTYAWNELHTRDYAGSQAFYSSVFGYRYDEIGDGAEMTYSAFKLSDEAEPVGGMYEDNQMPEGVPPHWLTWFAVDSCDDVLAKATSLGATVIMPATDSPFGRMGVLQGAQGEVFGVIDGSTTVGEMPAPQS